MDRSMDARRHRCRRRFRRAGAAMNDINRAVFELVAVPLWEVERTSGRVVEQNRPAGELFDAGVIESQLTFESLSADSPRLETHISAIARDGRLKTGRMVATLLSENRALVTFTEDLMPVLE